MGSNSKIAWTNHTWNPWRGCAKVSPACDNCYMMRDAKRFGFDGATVVRCANSTFQAPLKKKWADGARVFTCSWSDFFHPAADGWRGDAWEIIRRRPGLIFQILTKRHNRILRCLPDDWGDGYPNVWLGVTAENQKYADYRISALLQIPAAKHFVSIEPMLGAIDLTRISVFEERNDGLQSLEEKMCAPYLQWNALDAGDENNAAFSFQTGVGLEMLDWVICGGESGYGARPMNPEWARLLRDQCKAAGVPFFFRQMSGKAPIPADLTVREIPQ